MYKRDIKVQGGEHCLCYIDVCRNVNNILVGDDYANRHVFLTSKDSFLSCHVTELILHVFLLQHEGNADEACAY